MNYVWKQRVIAVRQMPAEIKEYTVTPGTETALCARLGERGWTAFPQGAPFKMVLTDPI